MCIFGLSCLFLPFFLSFFFVFLLLAAFCSSHLTALFAKKKGRKQAIARFHHFDDSDFSLCFCRGF